MVPLEYIIARLDIRDILKDAGIAASGNRIACPIHGGDNPTSFSFTDKVFCCHCCGAKGGLVALTAYLYECSEREAVDKLYELAGFPPPGDESHQDRVRHRAIVFPQSPKYSPEYYEEENKLAWYELLDEALSCRLRMARRAISNGVMPLEAFYLTEQICLYELEEIDKVIIEKKYIVNQLKKGRFPNDQHTASSN
ncbi:MAG: hypothetical protein AB1772_00695 [Candidatus Zixiibacteriota bacterium]